MTIQVHMDQVISIFGHLKKYHNTEMVFDLSDPVVDDFFLEKQDWTSSEFGHVDGVEAFPLNILEPRGLGFTIRDKVDVDHSANTITRRSRTGF